MNVKTTAMAPATYCLSILLALLPALGCQPPSASGLSEAAVDQHTKVWLIGWDGMAPWIVEPMIAAGKLPHLEHLMATGSMGELESLAPAVSPAIWTTIATGKTRDQHGIVSFWKEDPETGVETLFSSSDRKAAPLWRIADDAGMTSAVIGWWATWPAETIRGVVVSDRFAISRFDLHPKAMDATAPSEWLISPPEMERALTDCLRQPTEISDAEMARFTTGTQPLSTTLEIHNRFDELRVVFARDETHWCIAERLVQRESPNLLALYVQGTDIVNHYFLKYRFPERWQKISAENVDPGELDQFKNTIEAYYEWQDHRLGRLLELADSNTVVFVVSDHGFRVGRRARVPSVSGVHGGGTAPPGLLFVAGPGIRAGHRLSGAHVLDLAPTILSLWGLPAAHDQPGHILVDSMVQAPAITYVTSYGEGTFPAPAVSGLAADQEIIRSLKSVGYVIE